MRLLFSAPSGARCTDYQPNDVRLRIVVALAVLGLTVAALLLWQFFLAHTGDPLIAALLVGIAIVTLIPPAAKLLRS